MNKLCLLAVLVLVPSFAVRAQDVSDQPALPYQPSTDAVTAAQSIARVPEFASDSAMHTGTPAAPEAFLASTFVRTPATSPFSIPAVRSLAEPSPASPAPRFVFGGRDDFRWQLGLGVAVVRFRSKFYYATGVGTDTSVTYFTNNWFGFEGRVTTAFAPTLNGRDHLKFVGYGGGGKMAWRAQKLEPFVHALLGGMHILPKTAANSPNGLEFQLGGGAGYRFNPRLSARIVVDWMRTYVFGEWENNAQAALEAVLHF
jgi:hypothetical protein